MSRYPKTKYKVRRSRVDEDLVAEVFVKDSWWKPYMSTNMVFVSREDGESIPEWVGRAHLKGKKLLKEMRPYDRAELNRWLKKDHLSIIQGLKELGTCED